MSHVHGSDADLHYPGGSHRWEDPRVAHRIPAHMDDHRTAGYGPERWPTPGVSGRTFRLPDDPLPDVP